MRLMSEGIAIATAHGPWAVVAVNQMPFSQVNHEPSGVRNTAAVLFNAYSREVPSMRSMSGITPL
jgi:hypothetical protein